jgi:peptidoglycan/xylan/chitin deacetylase (PgdA/CDA1 family)
MDKKKNFQCWEKRNGNRKDADLRRYSLVFIVILITVMAIGCTGHLKPSKLNSEAPVKGRGFVIVTAKTGDTLSSLARTYLKDSRKGWWIAQYNDIQSVAAGQKLVIPLTPITYGGLDADGYQTVPILLYYHVANESKDSRSTTSRQFNDQLAFLEQNQYRTIRLDELYEFISLKDHIPPKSVVISFDTVEAWVYDIAYPLLKKHGMTGSVFIATEDIDKPGNLSWKQLAQMAADGFDIGTSGRRAEDVLTWLPDENAKAYLKRLENDIIAMKSKILKHTKTTCRYFAYPNGQTDDLLTAMLKKHGFRAAFTRRRGSNPFFVDAFHLRRSMIYGQHDMSQFKQNLNVFRSVGLR